ncbi:G-type lectin S-receptor-like serine/threonine-protein kinase SD1-1 [Cornus florida]|uniref:G-type lectin S-receptor-like serine/threonine-protein kinase SD1-1 n=1 Tax=Cornus florida TaxID=4283 RepID=UPI0028A29E35|nr:G-type lectin S-receptor-like serine/threonine-protein kinase SD1-1 [Cornus florida]
MLLLDDTTNSSNQKTPKSNNHEPSGILELKFYDLHTIAAATDNFSVNRKLGEGGFGPVYKGELSNGQEIAVKRLSTNSGQGVIELKNEVLLIAKLQHRNLVRVLGCCIENEETMLIYEYMPNKSLDCFIFDETRKSLLDWKKRHKIIVGIARGILYLHQDSRLRIIHRDLKAGNILLDDELNPKISDFGIARIFGGNQSEANTNRVMGTYGYMSLEYALDGLFSVKSDVFNFGVIVLEVISGKKSYGFFHDDPYSNLISYVWKLWSEDRALEIIDSSLGDSSPTREILRCIQVGLLCVQDSAMDRPTMSSVLFMLSNETDLPSPKQPAFTVPRSQNRSTGTRSSSINSVTITALEAR